MLIAALSAGDRSDRDTRLGVWVGQHDSVLTEEGGTLMFDPDPHVEGRRP
ncbi:hypothetical protein [Nocardia asiatica]